MRECPLNLPWLGGTAHRQESPCLTITAGVNFAPMRKLFILSVVLTSALLVGETQVSSPTVLKPPERLSADTPKTTVLGNAFVAPKDWSSAVKGSATILEAPEGDSWI